MKYEKNIFVLIILGSLIEIINSATCPAGGTIYEWGISEQGKNDVITNHNKYRQMIITGKVPNQPKGKNINMLTFDNNLANEAKKVSQTCKMNHVIGTDNRWKYVGQNLYISWNSKYIPGPNWAEAIDSWYIECKSFKYPNYSSGVTGHYTQLVWGKTTLVGCDYISFYDVSKKSSPYTKLYVCNYGPGGNYNNEAPYDLA